MLVFGLFKNPTVLAGSDVESDVIDLDFELAGKAALEYIEKSNFGSVTFTYLCSSYRDQEFLTPNSAGNIAMNVKGAGGYAGFRIDTPIFLKIRATEVSGSYDAIIDANLVVM
jgi:hypothetical protein